MKCLFSALGACLFLLSGPASGGQLVQIGQYEWTFDHPDFGGLSGLWLPDGGAEILAVSDRGSYVKAKVKRENGIIDAIDTSEVRPLPLVDNRKPEDFLEDAEGLAVAPDGSIYVSYEGHHRVWKFDQDFENPTWTHKWNAFWRFQTNSGLEALAADRHGVIYAIPERSGDWTRPFPVQRYKDGVWDETLQIPRSKKFLVVGADFGPYGKFYLLERDFDVFSGFKSRVRRFSIGPDGFVDEETLLETKHSAMHNAEGISVWTGQDGKLMLTTISDDNFVGFLKTLVTEFEVVD